MDVTGMVLYMSGAILVFSMLLHAFVKDDTTPKTHTGSWVFLFVATAIWPVVLPSVIRKKLNRQAALGLRYLD